MESILIQASLPVLLIRQLQLVIAYHHIPSMIAYRLKTPKNHVQLAYMRSRGTFTDVTLLHDVIVTLGDVREQLSFASDSDPGERIRGTSTLRRLDTKRARREDLQWLLEADRGTPMRFFDISLVVVLMPRDWNTSRVTTGFELFPGTRRPSDLGDVGMLEILSDIDPSWSTGNIVLHALKKANEHLIMRRITTKLLE